jgi:hypothetical protein
MKGSFDIFDRIAVINLPYRQDRRAEIAAQFSPFGLSFGKAPLQLFEAVRPLDAGGFPTVGTRGCFMSHLGALKAAHADGVERLLLLEDDCDFINEPTGAVEAALRYLGEHPDWDICYGGHHIESELPPSSGPWSAVPDDLVVWTAHCVGFSRRAMEAAVPYLEAITRRPPGDPEGGPMHVDGAYAWFRKAHPHLRTIVARPQIAHQRPSRTDIHELRWFDRLPLLRPLMDALRRSRGSRRA